jgi:hypothetical protein
MKLTEQTKKNTEAWFAAEKQVSDEAQKLAEKHAKGIGPPPRAPLTELAEREAEKAAHAQRYTRLFTKEDKAYFAKTWLKKYELVYDFWKRQGVLPS